MSIELAEILKLSVPEKILLVEAIWDSIANDRRSGNTYELTPEQVKLLEEELAAYTRNPEEGASWQEIKSRILKK